MRGAFIVIEGVDKCGKSTQARILCEKLGGACLSFPFRQTAVGRIINQYLEGTTDLDDHAVHLLFSANRWEKKKWIEDTLQSGQAIVCDRYAYSGVSYTAAKGVEVGWCKAPDAGLPRPDVAFFFQTEPESVQNRGEYGGERYERLEFQRAVSEKFKEVLWGRPECVVIDASQSIEAVTQGLLRVIEGLNLGEPLGRLWQLSRNEDILYDGFSTGFIRKQLERVYDNHWNAGKKRIGWITFS